MEPDLIETRLQELLENTWERVTFTTWWTFTSRDGSLWFSYVYCWWTWTISSWIVLRLPETLSRYLHNYQPITICDFVKEIGCKIANSTLDLIAMFILDSTVMLWCWENEIIFNDWKCSHWNDNFGSITISMTHKPSNNYIHQWSSECHKYKLVIWC